MKTAMRTRKLLSIFILGMITQGCGRSEDRTNAVRTSISNQIQQELHSGSSRHDIEIFFKKHKMHYAYDESNKRYQSSTKTANFESVLVLIYVGQDQKFAKAEVQEIFTGP